MILNITSYPRSGNSFFTITLLQFGDKWPTKGHPGSRPGSHPWVRFRPTGRIYDSQGIGRGIYGIECAPWHDDPVVSGQEDFNPVRYIEDPDSVYVYKRHDNPDDYEGPRIYLIRDGRDVLSSYAHHNVIVRLIGSDLENQEAIALEGVDKDLVNEEADRLNNDPNSRWGFWVERGMDHPNTQAVVRYEDMKHDATQTAMMALARCGYWVRKVRESPTFEKLQSFAPQFYRKGVIGDHRNLHPDIIRDFEKRNEDTLKRLRYL